MRTASAFLRTVIVLPAAGQTQLAQQCAAFGEAQYRKLSPSIDRITALDFPPPALERVEAKAGSQAVNAALTLRGNHLSPGPALRDAFRLPARCPAPAALLLRPAGIGDTRRSDAGDPRRTPARTADRRHADPAARPGTLERARAGAPGLAGKRRPAAGLVRDMRPSAAAAVRWRAAHPGGPHAGAGTHPRCAS